MNDTTRPLCSSCEEDEGCEGTPFAVTHCLECDENYCENCSSHHKKFKQTKNHNLEEIKSSCIERTTSFAQKPIQTVEPFTNNQISTDTKEEILQDSNIEMLGFAGANKQTDSCMPESLSDVPEIEIGSAKCIQFEEDNGEKPTYRLVLDLPCQCVAPEKRNPTAHHWWSCADCDEMLEYAFDEYFYCKCGRAKFLNVQFKCNLADHGGMFRTFEEHYMTDMLSKIKRKKEINILILGETGVGKSTWINSIVNYMTYPSLEEAAKQEKLLSLIGASFTITNDNYEMKEIKIGEDKNEEHAQGQSATQNPKPYLFEQETRLVRFIDTPGIGDTRGIEIDQKNFDNILKYLANLDKLDGICILLKPNNARLTILFRFCINELLTHLHKDVSKNIVFCFTNARSTFYRPGDTLPALQELLKEHKNTIIPLGKANIFCLDNEAFRFLCALREHIDFDENDKKNFSASWEKSVAETTRMIDYIAALQPHSLTHTLSLNETRKIIVNLTRPMADIAQNIQTNIAVVKDKEAEIKNCKDSEAELQKKLYIPAVDLVRKNLDFPRTVCTAPKCVKKHPIPNTNQSTIEYVTHCHEQCGLYGVSTDICPNPDLQSCCAMNQYNICNNCGCSWSTHMHIRYEYEQKPTTIKNESIEKAIQSNASNEEQISNYLKVLNERTKVLEDEQRVITEASVKFGCYLKTNAIAPFNDAMADYLDMLIGQEKTKADGNGDKKVLQGLNKMKASYKEEKEVLEKAMKSDAEGVVLGPLEIKNIVGKLFTLKENGSKLKEIVEAAEAGTKKMMNFNETVYRQKTASAKNKQRGFVQKASGWFQTAKSWVTPK